MRSYFQTAKAIQAKTRKVIKVHWYRYFKINDQLNPIIISQAKKAQRNKVDKIHNNFRLKKTLKINMKKFKKRMKKKDIFLTIIQKASLSNNLILIIYRQKIPLKRV